jgi:DNA-directed RNA polymerase subunit RPC12/RpoP
MKNKNKPKRDEDIIHRLQRENAKLKQSIQALRKTLSRVDIDRYQNLKEILESQEHFETKADKQYELDRLKKKWLCHKCGKDYLKLIIIPRLDKTMYIRKCQNCNHKTKSKPYTDDIEGIE